MLFLPASQGRDYNVLIISTIVDIYKMLIMIHDYNVLIISTIVDVSIALHRHGL